ncbi:hypothetical protein EDC04DRAFT_483186 [Pisolithus marmoratus]|nr:hypothetical protein EDC04DRAFT_483186 [Pisolithus marmoratus]
MPYDQTGDSPTANIGTYNDVAGNQHNTNVSKPGQQIVDAPVPSKVENDVRGDQHNANVSGNHDVFVSPRIVKKIVHEGKRILTDLTGNVGSISIHNDESVHNNANTTNNNDSHSVTNNTYHGPSITDLLGLGLGLGRQPAEQTTSQPQLGASNGGTGNTGPFHSGNAVEANNKSEQQTGIHTNEDQPKLFAVPSPEGGQGVKKPDAVPFGKENASKEPIERTTNEDPARHRPIETTEFKNIEDVPISDTPGGGSETPSVHNSVQASAGDTVAHHGVVTAPPAAEKASMSKPKRHSVGQPSGVLRESSSNIFLCPDLPPSTILPNENSQIAARILNHLRSYDGTRAPRQVSRIVEQVEKNSKIIDDAFRVVKYWEPKTRELKDGASVTELKRFVRGFWNAIVEVKASFEEVTSASRLIADETRQAVDQLMEQAKKDGESATGWTFSGAIACATVIGIPVGLVMLGRASHESGLGQQREKDAKHLDGIRKDTDSLATQMGRTAKWWSSLAEYISDIKRVTDGMEAEDTVPPTVIEALENLHQSLGNYISAHEPSDTGVSRFTSDL